MISRYRVEEHAYTSLPPGRRIDMFVAHSTGGSRAGDLWTLSGKDPDHIVSIHGYFTKIGETIEMVEDKDMAWHCGVSRWQGENDCNRFSIGAELENRNDGKDTYTQVQLDAFVAWARAKVQKYAIPRSRFVRHSDIALPPGRRSDPVNFPWERIVEQVYAPLTTVRPAVYIVRENGTRVREGWGRSFPIAWGGSAKLPEGREVEIVEVKKGESVTLQVDGQPITSDQWGRWSEDGRSNGFIWMGLLLPAQAV